MSSFLKSLSRSAWYTLSSQSMLAKQLILLKEASQMTSDWDQEGQARVCRVESWRKDIPGRGHSTCKGPEVRGWSGRSTGYMGRGMREGMLQAKLESSCEGQ